MVRFSLLVALILVLGVASVKYECYTRYYYQKTCYRFIFNNDCQKWDLKKCKPSKITRNDPKCPRFFCDAVKPEWSKTFPNVTSSDLLPTSYLPSTLPTIPPPEGTSIPSTSTRKPQVTSSTSIASTSISKSQVTSSVSIKPTSSRKRQVTSSTSSRARRPSTSSRARRPPEIRSTSSRQPPEIRSTSSRPPPEISSPVLSSRKASTSEPLTPSIQSTLEEALVPSWTSSFETVKSTPTLKTRPSQVLTGAPVSHSSLTPASAKTSTLLKLKDKFVETLTSSSLSLESSPSSLSSSSQTLLAVDHQTGPASPLPLDFVTSSTSEGTTLKPASRSVKTLSLKRTPTSSPSSSRSLTPVTRSLFAPETAGLLSKRGFEPSSLASSDETHTKPLRHPSNSPGRSSVVQNVVAASISPSLISDSLSNLLERYLIEMTSEKDCGDRVCTLDYRFVANCVMYIDKNSKKCDFPCSFENCQTELHHYVACPIWSCSSKTTSTVSPSDMSTLSPLPTNPSICSAEVCVPSIVFNVLFGIVILAAIGLFLIRRKRALARSDGIENPMFDDRRGPIIRRSERLPLLSRADRESNQGPSIPNFLARPSNSLLSQANRLEQETSF